MVWSVLLICDAANLSQTLDFTWNMIVHLFKKFIVCSIEEFMQYLSASILLLSFDSNCRTKSKFIKKKPLY